MNQGLTFLGVLISPCQPWSVNPTADEQVSQPGHNARNKCCFRTLVYRRRFGESAWSSPTSSASPCSPFSPGCPYSLATHAGWRPRYGFASGFSFLVQCVCERTQACQLHIYNSMIESTGGGERGRKVSRRELDDKTEKCNYSTKASPKYVSETLPLSQQSAIVQRAAGSRLEQERGLKAGYGDQGGPDLEQQGRAGAGVVQRGT